MRDYAERMVFAGIITGALFTGVFGCAKSDPHAGWGSGEGRIVALDALTDQTPSVPNTYDYNARFVFNFKGEKQEAVQRLSERKANLLTVGQDVEIHINPKDPGKSEIELPVPYPDKSGMNWRRMPRNLITKPSVEVK